MDESNISRAFEKLDAFPVSLYLELAILTRTSTNSCLHIVFAPVPAFTPEIITSMKLLLYYSSIISAYLQKIPKSFHPI